MTRRVRVRDDGPWVSRWGAAESFLALQDPEQTLDELFLRYRGRTKMPVDGVALRLLSEAVNRGDTDLWDDSTVAEALMFVRGRPRRHT